MIYKCGFVKVREGLRKKKSRRSDPEDKFVINSGKLLKPNFCENFCPYKLFLFLCHSFWMTLWVFLQYFRFSLEHIVIIFGQGLLVRAWEEKKQRREMQAGNQPPCLTSFTGSTKYVFDIECRTCFFSSQVGGELCWQCLARVNIVSLVNLSYQSKVTDRRNIEKRWRITKAKLFVSS